MKFLIIFALVGLLALASAAPSPHEAGHGHDGEGEEQAEQRQNEEMEMEEAEAMNEEEQVPENEEVAEEFQRLDSCLRRASVSLPRVADPDMLTAEQQATIRQVLVRSQCPASSEEEETSSRRTMLDQQMTSDFTFGTNSNCRVCNATTINLATQSGIAEVNTMMTSCALSADATCCSCLLKYVARNYWNAIFPPLNFTTTTPPPAGR